MAFLGDGCPLVWSLTGTVEDPGRTATRDKTYRPSLFMATAEGMQTATPDESVCVSGLETLDEELDIHPAVATTNIERPAPEWATRSFMSLLSRDRVVIIWNELTF